MFNQAGAHTEYFWENSMHVDFSVLVEKMGENCTIVKEIRLLGTTLWIKHIKTNYTVCLL